MILKSPCEVCCGSQSHLWGQDFQPHKHSPRLTGMQLLWRQPRRRVGSPVLLPQGRQHGHSGADGLHCPWVSAPRTAPLGVARRSLVPSLGCLLQNPGGMPLEMQLPQPRASHPHPCGALQAALPNSPLPPMFWCPHQGCSGAF